MIRPLGDRIVVERIEEPSVTAGGVVLPENVREKPYRGSVLAVGDGAVVGHVDSREHTGQRIVRSPLDVKVGDVVLFTKYGGIETVSDGKDVVILREGDLLGVEA